MPTPRPTATAEAPSVDAYAQEACRSDPFSMLQDGPGIDTWDAFAEAADEIAKRLDRVVPPAELQEFHKARLETSRNVRSAARVRTSDDGFTPQLGMFAFAPRALLFAFLDASSTFTDELILEVQSYLIVAAFGGDALSADLAARDALEALPQQTRAALENAGCAASWFGTLTTADLRRVTIGLEVGMPVHQSISREGELDVFRFTAQEGQLYQIDVELGTLDYVYLSLRGSDGRELTSGDDLRDSPGHRIIWKAPSTGHYYLAATEWGSLGSYTLTVSPAIDDYPDAIERAAAIDVGTPVHGAIDYVGDVDAFRFAAQAGQTYRIELGTLSSSLLRLWETSDYSLASGGNYFSNGGPPASLIVWKAPRSGDFYVTVTGNQDDSTGSYTLAVSVADPDDDHPDIVEAAATVQMGTSVPGTIDYVGDVDAFRFTAQEGQLYQVGIDLGTLGDWLIALLDPSGEHPAPNHIFESHDGSPIVWEAPSASDYYIAVEGRLGSTGSYSVTVSHSDISDDHANQIDRAAAIDLAAPVHGTIDYPRDVDILRFTAQQGQTYRIYGAPGTVKSLSLQVQDSAGRLLASDHDFLGTGASRIVWEAPATDDYYAVVAEPDDNVGSYTLTVSPSDTRDDHADNGDGATAIDLAAPVRGTIDYVGDLDVFRFTAREGQIYQVDIERGTLGNPALFLWGTGRLRGADEESGDTGALRTLWEAPSSDDFYIFVAGWDEAVGSYSLIVSPSGASDDYADNIEEAAAIDLGTPVHGSIDHEHDGDDFRFTAQAGQLYQVDVELGTLSSSYVYLVDSTRRVLASNEGSRESRNWRTLWEAPYAGDFYISVSGRGAIGSYTLTVSPPS